MHKTATQKPKILRHGRPIAVNSHVKYLGLWIDDNLNFDIHLKFADRKIAYAVGTLNKLKCYFPKKVSFATLSYINLSSSALCDSNLGFYLQILSPQNFKSPKQSC